MGLGHKPPVNIDRIKSGDKVVCFARDGVVYYDATVRENAAGKYIMHNGKKLYLTEFRSIIHNQ